MTTTSRTVPETERRFKVVGSVVVRCQLDTEKTALKTDIHQRLVLIFTDHTRTMLTNKNSVYFESFER